MRTSSELIADCEKAVQNDDLETVAGIVCEALGHLSDFSWKTGEVWDQDDVRRCCNTMGDVIYDAWELDGMQSVYRAVYNEMRGVAARFLEHYWDGCGDGEWRG